MHVRWVDAENMTLEEARAELAGVDGVLVPGGFGSRGWEGKILACRVAREDEIPYLGICLGMHVAVSEFARHVCGLDGANSTEMDPETPYPVIDLLPEQKEVEDLGGTMRLGAQAVELADGTRTREVYGDEPVISERHRHRYEVNNAYRQQLVDGGPRRQRHVPGGPARRDRRAARPPVVRRLAVPPRVQVAPDAAGAALPRVRRGGARARAHARPASKSPEAPCESPRVGADRDEDRHPGDDRRAGDVGELDGRAVLAHVTVAMPAVRCRSLSISSHSAGARRRATSSLQIAGALLAV